MSELDSNTIRSRCQEIFTQHFGYASATVTANEQATYRAAYQDGLEAAARLCMQHAGELTQEDCAGCGNDGDVALGASNDTARFFAHAIRQLIAEQKVVQP